MQILSLLFAKIFSKFFDFFAATQAASMALAFAAVAMWLSAFLGLFAIVNTLAGAANLVMPSVLATAWSSVAPAGWSAMLSMIGTTEATLIAYKAWMGSMTPLVRPWDPPGPFKA